MISVLKMSPLLQILVMLTMIIIQEGAGETDAQLSEALMMSVSTEHIRKQLEKFAPELVKYKKFIPNKNSNVNQWVVAAPLDISRDTDNNLKLAYTVDKAHQCYSNEKATKPSKSTICPDTCVNNINKLMTKVTAAETLEPGLKIHTEIQAMYREDGFNLMKNHKNKVILLYSYFIPCSQNQGGLGDDVFVECAGEMTNYMVRENDNENFFIVIYETAHEGGGTVMPISKLYLELGGIPTFWFDRNSGTLAKEKMMMKDFPAEFFVVLPVALQFSRPISYKGTKYTVSQIFADCIARNNFLMPNNIIRENTKIEFEVIKYFMYHQFGQQAKNVAPKLHASTFDTMHDGSKKYIKLSRQHCIVEACYNFAKEFSENEVRKRFLMTDNAEANNFFITFDGELSTRLDKPSVAKIENQEFCRDCIKNAEEYFGTIPNGLKTGVCEVKAEVIEAPTISARTQSGGKFKNRGNKNSKRKQNQGYQGYQGGYRYNQGGYRKGGYGYGNGGYGNGGYGNGGYGNGGYGNGGYGNGGYGNGGYGNGGYGNGGYGNGGYGNGGYGNGGYWGYYY